MDNVFRYTDLSFGPHAALLPFDPNKEVEIGLGLTVGLWNGILQGGIGYDLMDDSSDGVYYFVGSSLIGIVQGIGSALPNTSTNNATVQ
jgi:hypothetical protein